MQLEVPTWLERFDSLGYDMLRVFEAGKERAAVDVVKLLTKDPLVLCIVDLEVAVGRDTVKLALSYLSLRGEELTIMAGWRSNLSQ